MINALAKKTGVNKPVIEEVVNGILDEIISQLATGESVTFAGFGTFSPKERHARMGVNPLNPKEKIQMPATIVPKFKAGKTLKDSLKSAGVAPVVPTPKEDEEGSSSEA